MSKQEIEQMMADAGLKPPARGAFIFIHWDQIDLLLKHQRGLVLEEAAKFCESEEMPFEIELWCNSTKQEMTAHTARALADALRSLK